MLNNWNKKIPICYALFVIANLLLTNFAAAGTLSGGTMTLTFNDPGNLLNGLNDNTANGGLTSYYQAGFFPNAVADISSLSVMEAAPDSSVPSSLVFTVNPSSLAGTGIPYGNSLGGRNNQTTSLTWNSSQDALINSSVFSATGQVGLDGVILTRGSFTGSILEGDFSFQYVAARNNGVNSGWTFVNNVSFASPSYDTRDISVTTVGNELLFSGQLWVSPTISAFLFGGNGQTSAGEIGTFSLVSPAPVPVPEAIWLFGSGLLALLSGGVRKAVN